MQAPLYRVRNYKQRCILWEERENLITMQNAELDCNDETIEDYDAYVVADKTTQAKFTALIDAVDFRLKVLSFPKIRNEWFCDFVKSFETNKEIKLSYKQVEIFNRYGENDGEAFEYFGKYTCGTCGNLFFSMRNGFLTVKEIEV